MKIKKAGCILVNIKNKKIGLVYREKKQDYSFPKGHLEEGENLEQCAIRETEEETGRKNHIISKLGIIKYSTPLEDVECLIYLAIDDGGTNKIILPELQEKLEWVDICDVKNKLTYENLKQFWDNVENKVKNIIK